MSAKCSSEAAAKAEVQGFSHSDLAQELCGQTDLEVFRLEHQLALPDQH